MRNKGAISAYHKLYVSLKESIRNGDFPSGSTLPSENKLTQIYGISRVTVRKALEQLVQEGIVSKSQGLGTVVNNPIQPKNNQNRATGLLSNLVGENETFSSKTLFWNEITPPPAAKEKLQLGDRENCVLVRRVRYTANKPISYARIYLPTDVAASIETQKSSHQLILELLEETEFASSHIDFKISAAVADGESADFLELPIGSALLRMKSLGLDQTDRPIYYQDSFYHTDRYEYCGAYEKTKTSANKIIWKTI